MTEYTCQKCKKVMARLDTYLYHINRKNSCLLEERIAKKNEDNKRKSIEKEKEKEKEKPKSSNKDRIKELEDKVNDLSIVVKEQQIQIDKLMSTIDLTNDKLLSQLLQSISIKK